MPDDEQSAISTHSVASWRRYIILGGVGLLAIAVSIVVVSRRPSASDSPTNTSTDGLVNSGQNTITGRPTFERFQASQNSDQSAAPTVTQPTLEQTKQAIKELQQQ
jgi:hypothetical protein